MTGICPLTVAALAGDTALF